MVTLDKQIKEAEDELQLAIMQANAARLSQVADWSRAKEALQHYVSQHGAKDLDPEQIPVFKEDMSKTEHNTVFVKLQQYCMRACSHNWDLVQDMESQDTMDPMLMCNMCEIHEAKLRARDTAD